jgi:hypothetical protein
MSLHPNNCKWSVLIRVTTKQNPIKFDYTLYQYEYVLQKETSTKHVMGRLLYIYLRYSVCIDGSKHLC